MKNQSIGPKKTNFIKKNKQYISNISQKTTRSKSTALEVVSTNIPIIEPIKKIFPKSKIPGFSFQLNFPDIDQSNYSYTSIITNDYKLYPKAPYSDTDCPPSPPDYSLDEIKECEIEEIKTPELRESRNIAIQTEGKLIRKIDFSNLRRSQRIASNKELKRKASEDGFIRKKIKFN